MDIFYLISKLFSIVDAEPVSCELHGPFTFTYSRGHGECQYPLSTIDTCTDNSHLLFRFQACADVLGTESSGENETYYLYIYLNVYYFIRVVIESWHIKYRYKFPKDFSLAQFH